MAQRESVPSRAIESVCHVGDLTGAREQPTISYEGRGVSVSHHPEVWTRILRCSGDSTVGNATTYKLVNESGRFFEAVPGGDPRDRVVEWCIANEYVSEQDGYEVTWERDGVEHRMQFYEERRARREAAEEGRELCETTLLTLAAEGERYWEESFRQVPCEAEPLVIRDLTPVWFAEHHGFDGVWWDEELSPDDFSAPRGVIFQSSLSGWDISEL